MPDMSTGAFTGRWIFTALDAAKRTEVRAQLAATSVMGIVSTDDANEGDVDVATILETSSLFEIGDLGIFVIDPAQAQGAMAVADALVSGGLAEREPERIHHAITTVDSRYIEGARDALSMLLDGGGGARPAEVEPSWALPGGGYGDDAASAWGIKATGVFTSPLTGDGVKVCILDTGIDETHPAFAGRIVLTQSFIAGEAVQDGHGHGTHCAGTAAGHNVGGPRYGVAYQASIMAGKVLSNAGSGSSAGVIAGINWARLKGAKVISMSLGSPTLPGQPHSPAYETAAAAALASGAIIVAAAGNDSARNWGYTRPVSDPANCPSILAVAAVDSKLQVANFSNRASGAPGGEINVSGPGVAVLSAAVGGGTRSLSGTSMATPHVAGVLALLAEENPLASPNGLKSHLEAGATRILGTPVVDTGKGIVRA